MEINIPGIVNSTMPNRGNRTVGIVSHNSGPNHNDPGFLSNDFPHSPPKLYITAETDEFDALTLSEWRDEGFNVEYFSMGNGGKEYQQKLGSLHKSGLGPCETFGIVAYGDAASLCLEHYHILDNNPEFKMGCLIAYYPTRIPDPRTKFPSSIQVLTHLAGDDIGVVRQNQLVGIQGKKRISKRKVERGLGTGGTNKMAYPSYTYDAEPGFAEHDLDEYEKISAELAWSRSLTAARRAFRRDVDLETVLEQNVENKFYTRHLGQTMSAYTTHKPPHVTHFPTLTGGIGTQELQRFYSEFFINSNPPSMELALISRTMGTDRVVDELHVAFKHTQEMPWILPGLPPTNKKVEVMVVSIVTLRGGKLYHEHIYWDQASVLVQLGLLDPKLIPQKAKDRGVTKLPVVGREAARRVMRGFDDEEGEADNELIPTWYDDDDEAGDTNPTPQAKVNGGKAEEERKSKEQPKGKETQKPRSEPQEDEAQHPKQKPNGADAQNTQTETRNGDQPKDQAGEEPKEEPKEDMSQQEPPSHAEEDGNSQSGDIGENGRGDQTTEEKRPEGTQPEADGEEGQSTEQREDQPTDQPRDKNSQHKPPQVEEAAEEN